MSSPSGKNVTQSITSWSLMLLRCYYRFGPLQASATDPHFSTRSKPAPGLWAWMGGGMENQPEQLGIITGTTMTLEPLGLSIVET